MARSHRKIDDASGLRKPRLLARINTPDPQDGKPRRLVEHLARENSKLRARVVELVQQIRRLRGW
jgi:hypothetical protein